MRCRIPWDFKRENWRKFADLGWLGLPFPEEVGGFRRRTRRGRDPDGGVRPRACDRSLYLSTVLLAGSLIANAVRKSRDRACCRPSSTASRPLSFAHYEFGRQAGLSGPNGGAGGDHRGWTLHGRKIAVLDAVSADVHMVSARLPDAQGAGLALFLVPKDAAGVRLRDAPRLGGGGASRS